MLQKICASSSDQYFITLKELIDVVPNADVCFLPKNRIKVIVRFSGNRHLIDIAFDLFDRAHLTSAYTLHCARTVGIMGATCSCVSDRRHWFSY